MYVRLRFLEVIVRSARIYTLLSRMCTLILRLVFVNNYFASSFAAASSLPAFWIAIRSAPASINFKALPIV